MTRLMVSRLGKDPKHRKHMFRTMVTQLFKHERIKTTLPKAMALRFPAERMITLAKTNTLQNALQLSKKFLREREVVLKLLSVLKLRYLLRNGGYTRVHKCGFRKYDKAPMAYIELVDSPKEIGKRVEKRPKVYPTIEELREKAPTMDIYKKPVIHVSENKRTALVGGMVSLLTRLRQIPIPTVTEISSGQASPPNISAEFANLPGPGHPQEKEYQEIIAKSVEDIKKYAKDVLAKRQIEERAERERLRKMLHMDGTKKQLKAEKAKKLAEERDKEGKGEVKGEVKGEESEAKEGEAKVEKEGEVKAEAKEGKEKGAQLQGNKPNQQNQQQNQQKQQNQQNQQNQQKQQQHAKQQGNQQHQQHNKHKDNKNKNNNKKK